MRALDPYRIWLRYDDGVEGEVDMSDMAGDGVFVAWEDHSFFAGVHLGPGRSIAWSDEIDMCGDALYLEITGIPAWPPSSLPIRQMLRRLVRVRRTSPA